MKRIELLKLVDTLNHSTPEVFHPEPPTCRGVQQNLPPKAFYLLDDEQKRFVQTEIVDGAALALLLVSQQEDQLILVEKLKDAVGYQMRSADIPEEATSSASLAPTPRPPQVFPMPTPRQLGAVACMILVLFGIVLLWATASSSTGTDRPLQSAKPKKPGSEAAMPSKEDPAKLRDEARELTANLEKLRDEMTRLSNERAAMKARLQSTKEAADKADRILKDAQEEINKALKKIGQAETDLKNATDRVEAATTKFETAAKWDATKLVLDSGVLRTEVGKELSAWEVEVIYKSGTYRYALKRK